MERLVFATNNVHKLEEVRFILRATGIEILSLADIGCREDIAETADTLSGNALQKAGFVHLRYSCDCFADDTGLEVDALNGAPGVYSARYAGEGKSFDDNITNCCLSSGITTTAGQDSKPLLPSYFREMSIFLRDL